MDRRLPYKKGDRVRISAIVRSVDGKEIVDVPSFIGIVRECCRFGRFYKISPVNGVGGSMTLPPHMIEGRVMPDGSIKRPV